MPEYKNLRIIGLTSQNVMRLRAVEINPKTDVVVIGGNNGEGKTSVLESIVMALGGSKIAQEEPVRRGQKSALTVLDLGEIIVTRSFKDDGGSSLEVRSKEGQRFSSPQKMLEELVGRVCFDPIQFLNLDAAKQLATLRDLLGLDFSDLERRHAEAYGKRTDLNRSVKRLEAVLTGMPALDDSLPRELVDASELTRKLLEIEHSEEGLDNIEIRGREACDLVNESKAQIESLELQLASAKQRLVQYEKQQAELRHQYAELKKAIANSSIDSIRANLNDIKGTNERIKQNNSRIETEAELMKLQDEIAGLEKAMGDIDIEKEKALTAAKFPVEGLSFNDRGLLFNKVPFSQASAAQKLRTAIAMGIGLNPKIRVMIIRDGSLLDDENLQVVREMAAENNVQVWLERVGDGEECTIIIEDGEVLEDRSDKPVPETKKPRKGKGPKFA